MQTRGRWFQWARESSETPAIRNNLVTVCFSSLWAFSPFSHVSASKVMGEWGKKGWLHGMPSNILFTLSLFGEGLKHSRIRKGCIVSSNQNLCGFLQFTDLQSLTVLLSSFQSVKLIRKWSKIANSQAGESENEVKSPLTWVRERNGCTCLSLWVKQTLECTIGTISASSVWECLMHIRHTLPCSVRKKGGRGSTQSLNFGRIS